MEVRVDTYVEDIETGLQRMINLCLSHHGLHGGRRPSGYRFPAYILIDSEEARIEHEGAQRRREINRQRRSEGY